MLKHLQFVKSGLQTYPLSIVCFAAVWYLSFFTPPETQLSDVPFIDKWTHLVMYGGTCSVLWTEYLRSHRRPDGRKLWLWAWLAPVLMSGLIEVLQEHCTNHRRSGDWLDFAANTLGVSLAALIGWLEYRYYWRTKHAAGGQADSGSTADGNA